MPRWTSTHFLYYAESDDPDPCEAIMDRLEQHFAVMQAFFGFDWSAGATIRYDKYRDQASFEAGANCGATAAACESYGTVKSTIAFDQHELIHAYLTPGGRAPVLLEEGVAVVLTWQNMICDAISDPTPPELSWADAVRVVDPAVDTRVYLAGARLVGHLLRRYDPALFMRLYRAFPGNTTPEMFDAQMTSIYGKSADAMWAEAVPDAGCVSTWPCAQAPVPLDGSTTHLDTSCPGLAHLERTLDVTAPGNVVFSANADPSLLLYSCSPDPFAESADIFSSSDAPQKEAVFNLGSGKYLLQYSNSAADIAATVPAVSAAGAECAALKPLPVPSNQLALHLVAPVLSGGDWFVALGFGSPSRTMTILNDSTDDAVVCPSCDFTSSACTTLTQSMFEMDLPFEGDVYVRLRGALLGDPRPSGPEVRIEPATP